MKKLFWIVSKSDFSDTSVDKNTKIVKSYYENSCKKYGLSFDVLFSEDIIIDTHKGFFHKGLSINLNTSVFLISDFSFNPNRHNYLLSISRFIYAYGGVVLNYQLSENSFLTSDKLSMITRAKSLNLETIPTTVLQHGVHYEKTVEHLKSWNYKEGYILKPKEIDMGQGILYAKDLLSLESFTEILCHADQSYIIQPFIGEACDIRIYILNQEVVATGVRVPSEGHYISNVSKGGGTKSLEIPDRIICDSLSLYDNIGGEFIAIDWLYSQDKYYFSELCSAVCGYRQLGNKQRHDLIDKVVLWASLKI